MTYLQTEYFLHVAQNKSITKTASELYVSPPAISKQIALLEQELGIELFTRGAKGMELTPAGEIMFNHFYNQQTAFDAAYAKAKQASADIKHTLHLGVLAKCYLYKELEQIREYMKASEHNIDMEFHFCFDPGGDQLRERGKLDALITLSYDIMSQIKSHDLEFQEITRVPKIFMFSADNPIAEKPDLKPVDFQGIPMLFTNYQGARVAQQSIMEMCHNLGFRPTIILKDSLEDVLLAVGLNEGFFVCDSWMSQIKMPGIRYITLPETHSVVIAWWANNKAKGLDTLIDCCTNVIRWPSSI